MHVLNSGRPEIMAHAVHQADDIEKLIHKVSVIVIGPGLGQDDWAKGLFHQGPQGW